MKLGIDVGGTHTDAVIIGENGKILSWSKQLTSKDIISGIAIATETVILEAGIAPEQIQGVFVGTTHVQNALYHPGTLANTALIRIVTRPSLVKPALFWPEHLKQYVSKIYQINSQSVLQEIDKLLQDITNEGIESICIVGVNSPLFEKEEQSIHDRFKENFPNIPITMSHKLGSFGFIERENSALLNAVLAKVIRQAMLDLTDLFKSLKLECPCWLTQNDGSLLEIPEAIDYPLFTIGSGATNSFRGASILSGLSECIVVDFGGSTIEIGKISDGQPESVLGAKSFLNMDFNMRVPKMYSLPYGGGSLISLEQEDVHIKETIANDLELQGVSWGGSSWTLTDSFIKLDTEILSDQKMNLNGLKSLSKEDCQKVVKKVTQEIKEKITHLEGSSEDIPVVLVGGGSKLLVNRLFGKYKRVHHPLGYQISNAIGACFAPLSAQTDKVFWLKKRSKDEIILIEKEALIRQLLDKGAKENSIKLVLMEEYPFDYFHGEVLRIRLKAVGELPF